MNKMFSQAAALLTIVLSFHVCSIESAAFSIHNIPVRSSASLQRQFRKKVPSKRTMSLTSSSTNDDNDKKEDVDDGGSVIIGNEMWRATPDATSSDESLAQSLDIWPLDVHNAELLNEVRPLQYRNPAVLEKYDLVVIGAGAGGLVSSRQAARRGAKSCMISSELAGGDCLNAGCVPSKAIIRCAKLVREAKRAANNDDFGVTLRVAGDHSARVEVAVDFPQIMRRMRKLRACIAPVDGHARGASLGTQVFQGRGVFVAPDTVEVVEHGRSLGDESNPRLRFEKAVIATGGRPRVPFDAVRGLHEAPYITNLNLFNLQSLPEKMVIWGAGVVALEMAQAFAAFGSQVTVLARSRLLSRGDDQAASAIRSVLEEEGVRILSGVTLEEVVTLRRPSEEGQLPLMKLSLAYQHPPPSSPVANTRIDSLECDCLLVALGRTPNVDSLQLESANVQYDLQRGVLVNDLSQSISNPNVYAVGDCVADVPRLTHVSGEMAKVVVQNSLFQGQWKLSSLVIPAVMYTEPEYATVGMVAPDDSKEDDEMIGEVDTYTAFLEHNDRAILDSSDKNGFVKILCKKGTGTIVGCTIVASRAGEMINEVSLAMKHGIDLEGIGRNIHSYPTLGEAVMGCGLQWINSRWTRLDE